MSNIKPTKEALMLNNALNEVGIKTELEYWDGHKHVDIYIPQAKLYIEIDGVNHYTSVRQIMSDFQRDHYSDKEGYRTLRIPADIVKNKKESIVRAVSKLYNSY